MNFKWLEKTLMGLMVLMLPFMAIADNLYLKQNPDKFLCEYSHLKPSGGSLFGWKRRDIRMSSDSSIRLYRKKYDTEVSNFNSLTLNRMVRAYGFSEEEIRNAANQLGYRRNALERYALMRLLARQKIEHIILGMNEVLEYSRGNPLQQTDLVKNKMGRFEKMFFNENAHHEGTPNEAFAAIPSICKSKDAYVDQLVTLLERKMSHEMTRKNIDPKTHLKIHQDLDQESFIYSTEKNIAVTSLQEKLRKVFLAIKKLKSFKAKINGHNKSQLDLFKYYLMSKKRLQILQTLGTEKNIIDHIKKNKEYSPWIIYLKILFSNKDGRDKILKVHGENQLAMAIAQLPNGNSITNASWKNAFDYLLKKSEETQKEIDILFAINPLLKLDYKPGMGTSTLYGWLLKNSGEFKPNEINQYSPNFDYEIQQALAVNFVEKQLPALKRTCELLTIKPQDLICPESGTDVQNLILNEPMVNEIIKEEAYLGESAGNFLIDHYVTGAKQMMGAMVEMAALTVVTMGTGTVVSILSGGSKIAAVMNATRIARSLRVAKVSTQLFLRGKAAAETARIAHTGLNLYLLGHAIHATRVANENIKRAEEDAHTVIAGQAWGGQKAVDNAWNNFYLNAGFLILNGTLTKIQFTRFMKDSILIKNGIAFTKAKTPQVIVNALKKAGVEIRQLSTYKSVVAVNNRLRLISESFKRTISKSGDFIDAGTQRGLVHAEVIADRASVHNRAINTLRVSKATENIAEGTAVMKNGAVVEGFEMIAESNIIKFVHKSSGETFTLSGRLFEVVNKSGEFSIKVKTGAAWFGVKQGLGTISVGTNSTSYALFLRTISIPKATLKSLSSLVGGGVKLAVGGTVVAAAGITLFLESSVNKFIVGAADKLRDYVPSHWEGTHESIDSLITRLGPKAINQVERQAKIREFTIKKHVRGVLDYFQDKTNQLEDKFSTIDRGKWYIDGIFKNLAMTTDQNEILKLKGQLQGFIERQEYYTHRFDRWVSNVQRNINYNAEWYTFYGENQALFDQYWDEFYAARKEIGFANEFSKDCNKDSCTLRYGLWVASYPSNSEQTQELKDLINRMKSYKNEVSEYKKIAKEKYGLTFMQMPSDVSDYDNTYSLNNKSKGASDVEGFAHYLASINDELNDKQKQLKELVDHFETLFERIMSDKNTELENIELRNKIIKTLGSLYTLNIRDFYQWKNHIKDVLESRLYQLMIMPEEQREYFIQSLSEYTKDKVIIKEMKADESNPESSHEIKLTFSEWIISTGKYEDSIEMKEVEVNFYKKLREIEKKILLLKKVKLIPHMTREELTQIE